MLVLIPDGGIIGETAMREAAAGEFRHIVSLLRSALAEKLFPGRRDAYVDIEAAYADRVIVRERDRLYAYPYTLSSDNQVQLGERQEVVLDFQVVSMREADGSDLAVEFIEALDKTGSRWRIRVIESGWSKNGWYYSDAVLRESAPLFNGARVFSKSDEEHLAGKGKSFSNLIGGLSNATFVEAAGETPGAVYADFDVLQSAGDVPAKMREAYERGMAGGLFGFSIDVKGKYKFGTAEGRRGRIATSMKKVESVDLIIEPGAGGQLVSMIEAFNPEEERQMALRDRMVAAIQTAHNGTLPAGLDIDNENELEAAYREAVATMHTPSPKATKPAGGEPPAGGVSREELDQTVRMVEARAYARATINASTLPDRAKQKLLGEFDGDAVFREADVDERIKSEREYLASFTESGHVQAGGGLRVEGGEDRSEKVAAMLDAFFDPDDRSVTSFRECYIDITGDARVTGHLRDCDEGRMREALGDGVFREALNSGSWANVLGDSITRRMQAEYRSQTNLDVWRFLTGTPVPLNDFRTQERVRYGGYGDLPIVAEDGAYNALTSPTDDVATYAPAKRGGTETISLEMVKNDDVGAIQRLPMKLSRAAKRTLSKFVLDFIRTNPLIYDGVALFDVAHGNLGTAALSPAELAARRLAMMKQTEPGSNEQLGIPPKYLWVPADLEETAFDLFRRTTNNDTDFVESLQMQVVPVWYWTDVNDWAVTADPMDMPFIEIGFMDGNEEPELFVQDNPTQGSLFSNDQIKYKLRHIYGAGVLDYRPAQKCVVV